jgi:hypothetical protein
MQIIQKYKYKNLKVAIFIQGINLTLSSTAQVRLDLGYFEGF